MVWKLASTLPYSFYYGSAVVLNGEIHILGGYDNTTEHYKYSNGDWTEVSTLPYDFYQGSAVVLDGEIHILGSYSSDNHTKHYKYSNGSWTEVSTLPYSFYYGSAVLIDGEIHILGSNTSDNFTKHYKYSNGSWTEVSILPYKFYRSSAVVLNGEIHILGSNYFENQTSHYKYSNGAWIEVSTLPYSFFVGSAVVLDGEIHILGGGNNNSTKHYKYSNGSWTEVSTLPYNFYGGSSVVLNEEIHILGSFYNAGNYTKHYRCYTPINKVVYGNESLIDLTDDTITTSDIMVGKIAHLPSGVQVVGTGTSDATAVESEIAREKTAYVGGSKITGTANILTCAKKVVFCHNRKVIATESAKTVLNLNDTYVDLSYSGANVLLTAGSSSITIASPGADYVGTFYISSVHYINRNQALIAYRYETNASGLLSRVFYRLITLKYDGTLAQSSQINGSAAPTASLDVEGYLIPMFEAKTSWMLIYTARTISTGAMAIYVSRMYAALSTNTLTIPSSSTWTTVAASNVNTEMPGSFDIYFSEYGGLFFYEGANSKVELDIWAGYSGGNKNVYASAAGDIADLVDANYHILGKTSDGYLAINNGMMTISLYSYDPVTCYFTKVAEYDVSGYTGGFNWFLLNNGLLLAVDADKLFTLTANGLELFADITSLTEKDYPLSSEIGPLSDPFQGIFIS